MSLRNNNTLELIDLHPPMPDMAAEVKAGLRATPRYFPSHYLYNEAGLALFNEICETDEYYITRTELALLDEIGSELAELAGPECLLVAPGSGAGLKPRRVIHALQDISGYIPIDISREFLEAAADELSEDEPDLVIQPICADFTSPFELPEWPQRVQRNLLYFPGSTIGNFTLEGSRAVLERFATLAGRDGLILVGVDLQKSAEIIEPAYDDKDGYSAAFALNLLTRLNDELDADFVPERFGYNATYDAKSGRIEMSIVSTAEQIVTVAGDRFELGQNEHLRTEYSQKFTHASFAALAESAGLAVKTRWTDPDDLFSLQLLTRR